MGLRVQFYRFKVGGKVRVGEVTLELLPTLDDMLGSDIPQAMLGSRGMYPRVVVTLPGI